ncbi:MAG: beta-lactamase family protein, partial [Leptonema sp. (in: Bacteria)]|nr:beta-lactamase family protein [Leptonema sp. (in: bacteria)]
MLRKVVFKFQKITVAISIFELALLLSCGASRTEPSYVFSDTNINPVSSNDLNRVANSQERLERFMAYNYGKKVFPSFAVGVFDRSGFIYTHFISSDLNKQYSTGSVTKLLTATLLQMQLERRRLQPFENIDRYFDDLSELRWNHTPITIQNLVTHTGGFPDLRYFKTTDLIKIESIDLKVPMPIYPPSQHYRYSNHGYIILGHILEKVCGNKIEECIKRDIYEPIGMTESKGPTTGAGGYVTTLQDLMLFGKMYLNGGRANGRTILAQSSMAEMVHPGFYIPPSEHRFFTGRGWRVRTAGNQVVTMFHIGGANYTSAWLQLFPPYNVGICYLGNPPEYTSQLESYLVAVQYMLADIAGAYVNSNKPLYEWSPDQPTPELAKQFNGIYINSLTENKLQVEWQTKRETSQLMAKFNNEKEYTLFPETHQVYNGGNKFISHQFIVEPKTNQVIAIATSDGYYVKQPDSNT